MLAMINPEWSDDPLRQCFQHIRESERALKGLESGEKQAEGKASALP